MKPNHTKCAGASSKLTATPAERDLMAVVTHHVASLFAPEQKPGRVTAENWQDMLRPAPGETCSARPSWPD
jgi:hypothetical protein